MSEIQRTTMEKAARELRSIAERHAGSFRSREIDWAFIRTQLEQLRDTLEKGDSGAFSEALGIVVTRLAEPLTLRNAFGPDPINQSTKMPSKVLALVNHLVEPLDVDVQQIAESNQQPGKTQMAVDPDRQTRTTS